MSDTIGDSLRFRHLTFKIIVPLLILVLAGGIAFSLIQTAPRPERKAKPRQSRLVTVTSVTLANHAVTIHAWGHVQPAHQVTLHSQVEGKIIDVSPEFVPGGRFAKNAVILRIDPSDYELAVRQRHSVLAKARADLLLEEGNQIVAHQEFKLLGGQITARERNLVLRLPQLQSIKADVASAAAALQAAKLSLTRTVLKAPFDAMVLQPRVDLGAHATPATDIATLVGTDEYWVEIAVPVTQLPWIHIPATPDGIGSTVRLHQDKNWGKDTYRMGHVIRLMTDLETEGRMARLLVTVQDPLNLQAGKPDVPPVLLGSYLRAEIQGRILEKSIKLDRHLIHDQDTVWLMKPDHTLEIRPVTIAFRGPDHVLVVEGLDGSDQIVVSDIPAPMNGMALRLMEPILNSGTPAP